MSLEGQRLGEFEILECLGQGGMGAVYKARQISLDRLVALKALQAAIAADPEYIARFRREAKSAAALSHQNLVQVYAAGENDGLHWFAMEYIEGESAQNRLKRKGRIEPAEAVAIAIHVSMALEYGWKRAQLIHRDIKPDNIFLSSDGEVKLGDLGLAKSAGESQSITMTGSSMGTPHYVSPEQGQGKKEVDLRADIYSLGCTLFHLVSGEPPFKGDTALAVMMQHVNAPVPNLRTVWPACPEGIARVVMKMMLKQPAARQQSYGEVLTDLRAAYDAISGATVPARMAVTQQPAAKQPPRQPPPAARKPVAPRPAAATVPEKRPPFAALAGGGIALGAAIVALIYFASWKKDGQLSDAERRAKERAAQTSGKNSGDSTAATPATATNDKPFVNTLGQEFVPVPGTQVLFCRWETRVKDYAVFAKAKTVDASWTKQEKDGVPVGREPDHPVCGVSWKDAHDFCAWLTEKEIAEGKLGKGMKYRLPTDEEWSRAVGLPQEPGRTPKERSAKDNVNFPWGTAWPLQGRAGNYADETCHEKFPNETQKWFEGYRDGFATTAPVGSFEANPFGIYDLGGNVSEWCEDLYAPGVEGYEGTHYVLRGLAWYTFGRTYLLSSYRDHAIPAGRDLHKGFRCVLAPAASGSPAAAAYPQPAAWTDGTAQLRTYLASGELAAEGEWVHAPGSVSKMFNLAPGRQFRNPIVRVRYSVPDSGRVDICLRRVRNGNDDLRYNAGIDAAKVNLVMTRPAGSPGPPDVLTRAVDLDPPTRPDEEHEAVFAAQGDTLTVWIDGRKVSTAQDGRLSSGELAMMTKNYSSIGHCRIRKVEYAELPEAPAQTGSTPATPTKVVPLAVNTLGQEFVAVPGTQVLFCRWETRVKDYAEFAKAKTVDASWTKQEKDGVPVGREPEHPVCGVNWDDANAFCKWLTEKESAEGKLAKGFIYRLPTDEEWSRAVGLTKENGATPKDRSGRSLSDFPWGKEWPPKGKVANYADAAWHEKFPNEKWLVGCVDGYATTAPVGSFAPNGFGIYDLGGNVWEWCEDLFEPPGTDRVLRGGSWLYNDRNNLVSSDRYHMAPGDRRNHTGFRCVLAPAAAAK